MSIKTIITCDRCNAIIFDGLSKEDNKADGWRVGYSVTHQSKTIGSASHSGSSIWCRHCVVSLLGCLPSVDSVAKAPDPPLSISEKIERVLVELIEDVIEDHK